MRVLNCLASEFHVVASGTGSNVLPLEPFTVDSPLLLYHKTKLYDVLHLYGLAVNIVKSSPPGALKTVAGNPEIKEVPYACSYS